MRFRRLLALTALAAVVLTLLGGLGAPAEAQTDHPVVVGDFYFCDPSVPPGACQTVINAGDTVTWDYATGSEGHTVTECGQSCDKPTDSPVFDSQILRSGKSYSFTFESPGTYLYHCQLHPEAMRASVVVRKPPATVTPSPSPSPTQAPLITAPPSSTASASPSPSSVPSITLSPTRSPGSPTPARSGASPTASVSVDTGGGGGFPTWALVLLLVVAMLAAVGGFALFVIRSQR